jgi:hypothetical protein
MLDARFSILDDDQSFGPVRMSSRIKHPVGLATVPTSDGSHGGLPYLCFEILPVKAEI